MIDGTSWGGVPTQTRIGSGDHQGTRSGNRIEAAAAAAKTSGSDGRSVDRKVNIAIVGLGYWGPNRLRALNEIEERSGSWICDRDTERLATLASRYPARPDHN